MLSVVIPAFDEEDAIGQTVRTVKETLAASDIATFEIIVVDDGSADRTHEIAAAEGACVIRHLHNLGYGRSLKDGIELARYPAIVITDADGTYPIKDIPRLFALYGEGYHMVVGSRTGKNYRESVLKSPLRWILQHLVEYTASRRIPDINSGLRIFSRDHARAYLDRLCDTFSFTTSLTLAFMMNGLYVVYVPIDYYKRIGKTKVRLLSDSLRTLQYIAEAAVYYNPLRVFMLLSASLIAAAAVLIGLNVFLQTLALFYIAVGCIIVSIQTFASGLIATLLKQILQQQQIGTPVASERRD
ncbi:glycosyltransferase family 2 protein [Bradyrhizobium sp.]|jgi:glycosyltransferase involved in cell wall biosynthesis|uniref:glycosyltransferase family 2 protein n=1 Tax=Bradyrhizobium sp. TaxID=376 RepID=UPI002DFB088A|nr:glycosyltransferase family 2 protein [Bradyrhizobium sp.]